MEDQKKTKAQLIKEIEKLRRRFNKFESLEKKSKQAENSLRESEEKYRKILENIAEGYYEVDLAGHFTFFNDSVCRILGYTRNELMGMNNRNYTDPKNSKNLYQAFNHVYRTGDPFKGFEWEIIRKDGTIRSVEASVSLIRNPKGEPTGFRGIVRDITEQKEAGREMIALQEELRQSQKMEAIGRLAGGIAHDFNNLLTVISGNCQLSLLDLKEGDPLRRSIEEIRVASDRASSLTRQLLAFSRRQTLNFMILDLNDILRNLDKMLHRVIGEDIELIYLLSKDIGKIKTDPGQVEQVILNLALNARDAMPKGGKLILETANAEIDDEYVQAHIGVKPGRYVRLSVSDTGAGIPPEVRERIFEPFFTTKENGKGIGLGLSTVYGIVKQSGGNIWVYSEPGYGTVFKVYFPRAEEPVEVWSEKVKEIETLYGGETILLVEDDEAVRKLAMQILRKQGYKVLEAKHGGDALLISKKYQDLIHLMVTDVVMPGMSGRELAENLLATRPEMKVLYISGYTDNTIVHLGVLEPEIHFIQKPFTMEALAKKVREVLDSKEKK
jgi:PAS domain S-box-containing protein